MIIPYRHERQMHPWRRGLQYGVGFAGTSAAIPRVYNAARAMYNWYNRPRQSSALVPVRMVKAVPVKGYGKARKKLKPMSKGKSLKKQVKNIQQSLKSERGILIWRAKDCAALNSTISNVAYAEYSINNLSNMETCLANLRYYNPSDPATLVTASAATGSFYKSFLFKSIYALIDLTNNYQIPCTVRVYVCQVKDDTNITPNTAFENGLADVGNPDNTSPLCFPTDSPQFTEMWRILKTVDRKLLPGRKMTVSHSVKNIQYDPSLSDSHTSAYQTRYKPFVFYVRICGVEGHDTTVTTEHGTLAAGVDVEVRKTFTVEYDAGADIKTIVLADASDTSFTNAGVVSSMPVSDNIGYSIA